MRKFINVCWFLTFVLFFTALALSYAYLPEEISVHTDKSGATDLLMQKETFYYAGLIIFVVSNLVSFYFVRVLDSVPASTGLYFKNQSFKNKITSWFAGFVTMINVFLVIAVSYIAVFNSQEYRVDSFSYVFYLIPILVVAILVWLLFIFNSRHQQLDLDV